MTIPLAMGTFEIVTMLQEPCVEFQSRQAEDD